jgi:excisionase family DNA binding protein
MPIEAAPRPLLLVDEVADLGRCSSDTVRRAIATGTLPAVRLGPGGRLLRIRRADAEAWLDGAEARPRGAA